MTYVEIDINTRTGLINDIVIMDRGKPDTALELYGWDEVGMFDSDFADPVYAVVTLDDGDRANG